MTAMAELVVPKVDAKNLAHIYQSFLLVRKPLCAAFAWRFPADCYYLVRVARPNAVAQRQLQR